MVCPVDGSPDSPPAFRRGWSRPARWSRIGIWRRLGISGSARLWSSAVLGGCVAALTLAVCGCGSGDSEPQSSSVAQAPRTVSTVPLRVLSTATAEFNDRLQQSWAAVSEQPVELTPATAETLREQTGRTDVVLFRNSEMGLLQSGELLTPLPESFLQSAGVEVDSFLPGLVSGSATWGGSVYALPLGSNLPAVWIAAGVDAPQSLNWQQYSQLIASLPEGTAAEPLAEGWAAVALLDRASSQTGAAWMFDRVTLQPVIADPPYVRALEQLVADRQRYPDPLLTAEQVWERLRSGELQIAIGWPAATFSGPSGSPATMQMVPYPAADEVFVDRWQPAGSVPRPPSVSPRSLLVGIAASCRQTSAARGFLTWLAGREGHAAMRRASADVAPNRLEPPASELSGLPTIAAADLNRERYDRYVIQTFADGQVRPSLRLPAADEYLTALDARVRAALSGQQSPQEALSAAAEDWEAITDRAGRPQQLRAWRESQGLGGG